MYRKRLVEAVIIKSKISLIFLANSFEFIIANEQKVDLHYRVKSWQLTLLLVGSMCWLCSFSRSHLVKLRSVESYYTAQQIKWIVLGRTRFSLNHGTCAFSSPLSSAIYNSLHNPSAPVFSVWFSSPSTSKTFPLLLSHCCARGVAQHHIKAAIFWRMRSGLPNIVMYFIWKSCRLLPINFT